MKKTVQIILRKHPAFAGRSLSFRLMILLLLLINLSICLMGLQRFFF